MDTIARGLAIQAKNATLPGCRISLIGFGDSRMSHGTLNAAPAFTYYRYAASSLVQWQLVSRVDCDWSQYLFATSGATLNTLKTTQLPSVIAACQTKVAAGYLPVVLVHALTNDIGTGATLVQMQADVQTVKTAVKGVGGVVVWLLEHPRSGGSVLSAGNEANRLLMNTYLLSQADKWFRPVNYLPSYTSDGTYTGSAQLAALTYDGLHDTSQGADVKAQEVISVLSQLEPLARALPYYGSSDTFNASTNVSGNRLSNGQMTGSVAVSATSATGNAPTSWTADVRNPGNTAAGASLTCAFSKEISSGRERAVMTLGGTGGSGEFARLLLAGTSGSFTTGQTLRWRVRVQYSGLSGVQDVRVNGEMLGTTFVSTPAGAQGSGDMTGSTREEVIEFYTTVLAGMTQPRMTLAVYGSGTSAVSGTVKWSEAEVRAIN